MTTVIDTATLNAMYDALNIAYQALLTSDRQVAAIVNNAIERAEGQL